MIQFFHFSALAIRHHIAIAVYTTLQIKRLPIRNADKYHAAGPHFLGVGKLRNCVRRKTEQTQVLRLKPRGHAYSLRHCCRVAAFLQRKISDILKERQKGKSCFWGRERGLNVRTRSRITGSKFPDSFFSH